MDRTKKKERKIRMLVWPNGAKSSESSALAARTFNFSDLLFFYPQAHHFYFTTESSKHKKSGKQQNDVETTSRPKKESSSTLEKAIMDPTQAQKKSGKQHNDVATTSRPKKESPSHEDEKGRLDRLSHPCHSATISQSHLYPFRDPLE